MGLVSSRGLRAGENLCNPQPVVPVHHHDLASRNEFSVKEQISRILNFSV
jgi:hypothetical protein